MKAYTISQLQFASEMAFPDDMERLMAEHWPGNDKAEWKVYYLRWLLDKKRNLFEFIFTYSRADFKSELANGITLGEYIERIIDGLIGGYQG